MIPYADFTFFGLMLIPVLATVILGLFGRANSRWTLFCTAIILVVLLSDSESAAVLRPGETVRQIWLVLGYAVYQAVIVFALLRWHNRWTFYAAVALSILPLALGKFLPFFLPESRLGFLGISYVTFRALDVVFSIHDRVITQIAPAQYFTFLFFFPTLSSGPIDRYRRFGKDWATVRGQGEFLDDLDAAISRVFQGFLYKFIIAALISTYWMDRVDTDRSFSGILSYMYAYTAYLFFDFAGYSAFAIGFSRLFGIHSPENFDKPFLARNIKDFWNRWHISLSFWFRDHVYMRFLLAAGKGKWFKGRHTASYLGFTLTFGLMGIWHGPELRYILYGLYHAALLCGYEIFSRWNKKRKLWGDGRVWRGANIVITGHVIAFGLLLFSGHITPQPVPRYEQIAEQVGCEGVVGWAWDSAKPNEALEVIVYVDGTLVDRVQADKFRQDLQERRMGDGRHGFRWEIPHWVQDGNPHTIEVQVADTGRILRGTPAVITCGVAGQP